MSGLGVGLFAFALLGTAETLLAIAIVRLRRRVESLEGWRLSKLGDASGDDADANGDAPNEHA